MCRFWSDFWAGDASMRRKAVEWVRARTMGALVKQRRARALYTFNHSRRPRTWRLHPPRVTITDRSAFVPPQSQSLVGTIAVPSDKGKRAQGPSGRGGRPEAFIARPQQLGIFEHDAMALQPMTGIAIHSIRPPVADPGHRKQLASPLDPLRCPLPRHLLDTTVPVAALLVFADTAQVPLSSSKVVKEMNR